MATDDPVPALSLARTGAEFLAALVVGTFLGGVTGGLPGVISFGDGYSFGFTFEEGAVFSVPSGFVFAFVAFVLLKPAGRWDFLRVAGTLTAATWTGAIMMLMIPWPRDLWDGEGVQSGEKHDPTH